MTCIAYRYPFIVGDHRVVDSAGYISATGTKLYNPEKGLYIGYSGDCGYEDDVIEYIVADRLAKKKSQKPASFKDKASVRDKDADSISILVIHKTDNGIKVFEYYKNFRFFEFTAEFAATGCGAKLAIGAMAYGADAWGGVAASAKMDPYVGWPIDGYHVETGAYVCYKTPLELEMKAKESDLIKFSITVPEMAKALPQASGIILEPGLFTHNQLKLF